MKQIIKNYTFNATAKTITLTDFSTVRLDRLQLIVDTKLNQIAYNFADTSVATATVATNVITLSAVPSGAANADALMVIYDCASGDPVYDGGQRTMANSAPVALASDQSSIPVTGSFWQTTQPVSASALPLPAGAATASKQPAPGTAGSASADVVSVQGVASMTALKTDSSATTQPVSAASLPLPSGASTSAKQPALGTAGTAASDVLSIQGVSGMTALKVDASATTQPVSGTVTVQQSTASSLKVDLSGTGANTTALKTDSSATTQPVSAASLPLPTGAATAANQATGNTSLSDIDSATGTTSDAAVVSDANGTVSGKLRGLVKMLADMWDSTNHFLKVSQATLMAGEDQTNNVMRIEQQFIYQAISTATTTTLKSGAGFVHTLSIIGGTAGSIVVYDSTTGSGTTILPSFTPGSVSVPATITLDSKFSNGLTIVTGAATVLHVSYR